MPEVIQKQLDAQANAQKALKARINKLALEIKQARIESNLALTTSQKEKAIGQVNGKLAQGVLFW